MLGLAFQGQGQLDIAFDKFRKVRRDDSLMEVLYNLGLDFERKRQFNKDESVFKYMASTTPSSASGSAPGAVQGDVGNVILGGSSARATPAPWCGQGGVCQADLGRYEIENGARQGGDWGVYTAKTQDRSRGGDQDHGVAQELKQRIAGCERAFLPRAETADV